MELKTGQGLVSLVGPEYTNDGDFVLSASMGIMSYPDTRVTKFRIYCALVDEGIVSSWRVLEWAAKHSEKSELSYCVWGAQDPDDATRYGLPFSSFTAEIDEADIVALPSYAVQSDPNLVLVSEAYQPRMIYGRSALPIGNDAEDEVLCLAANAQPISAGQYGQHPVIAFCRHSRWALEAGTNTAFSRAIPLSVNEKIVGRHAVTNVGESIFYATTGGLFMQGGSSPISAPIQNSALASDLLRNMDESTTLAHFEDPDTGRREIWVSTRYRTYCYSIPHQVWFTRTATRQQYVSIMGRLAGISDGGLYSEAGDRRSYLSGQLTTAPIHLQTPEVLKRWRKVICRFVDLDDVEFSNVTDYELILTLPVVTGVLLSIDYHAEARYAHRIRIRRDSRTVISGVSVTSTPAAISEIAALTAEIYQLRSDIRSVRDSVILSSPDSVGGSGSKRSYKGRILGVSQTGTTVTFDSPFSGVSTYLPTALAISADGTRLVSFGMALTASGITFTPAEDDTTIVWKAEEL
jgi:hypothetical protein